MFLLRTEVWRQAALLAQRCRPTLLIVASACYRPDDGQEPDLSRIYFPTGAVLSSDGQRLVVANSDWDLQYNAGTVHLYDLSVLRGYLPRSCERDADCADRQGQCDTLESGGTGSYLCVDPATRHPCGTLAPASAAERLLSPAPCSAVPPTAPGLLLDTVATGAFAGDLLLRPNPAGGDRLFLPVRSDATLHWIDLAADGSRLDCGQGTGAECDSAHRRRTGTRPAPSAEDGLPLEPFGVTASADGRYVVTSHQSLGYVSLFANDWEGPVAGPDLLSVGATAVPANPIRIVAMPVPRLKRVLPDDPRSQEYQPGFWTCLRGTSQIHLFRLDEVSREPNFVPALRPIGLVDTALAGGGDLRDLAVDGDARNACEVACTESDAECLVACASIPLDVYLASRAPDALLVGHTVAGRGTSLPGDDLVMTEHIAVGDGPARVVVGSVIGSDGAPEKRVFVLSFDGRAISIYNPVTRSLEATVATGRGPQALAIDPERGLGYVAHFTDSYIGVLDLDRRHRSYGTLLLNLGQPTRPRGDE